MELNDGASLMIAGIQHFCMETYKFKMRETDRCSSMPQLARRKCKKPDACLDEEDLKDIAEAKEEIRQGKFYTTKELRAKLGIE